MNEQLWVSVILQCVGKSANRAEPLAQYADEVCAEYARRFEEQPKSPLEQAIDGESGKAELPSEEYGDLEDAVRYLHSDDVGDE